MKVLQINAVYGKGSTGVIVKDIGKTLVTNGDEAYFAYQKTNAEVETGISIGNKLDWKWHALHARLFGKQGYASKKATRKFLKWVDTINPDVVHLHNLHSNYINFNMLCNYLAEKKIPTVITLHDCWFFTGKCTHYTTKQCKKWQDGCRNCSQLKKDIPSWFFDRTSKMWREKKELFEAIPRLGVIGVSDWITGEAKNSFLKNATIIERIYNWVDLEVFYPRREDVREKYVLPKDKFLVFCIGAGWNENSSKYQDLLALSDKLDADTQIVLAGAISKKTNLPKNITSIGYINSTAELAKLYSQADVYVHVSKEDTFGKVIAEAMACGTPAIVYTATACPELIGEGCGHVVDVGDVDGIKQAIDKIKSVGKGTYSQACVDFVKENFEKEKLIKETIALYERL